jgi:hypothetical protein
MDEYNDLPISWRVVGMPLAERIEWRGRTEFEAGHCLTRDDLYMLELMGMKTVRVVKAAEAKPTCENLVRGDARSPNGTNRYTFCTSRAVVIVTSHYAGKDEDLPCCGVHAKRHLRTATYVRHQILPTCGKHLAAVLNALAGEYHRKRAEWEAMSRAIRKASHYE